MLKFTVNNGTNQIAIDAYNAGSYLRFGQEPLAATWQDKQQHVTYYTCLGHDEAYRNLVNEQLDGRIKGNYDNNLDKLLEALQPLIQLFKNAEYELSFHEYFNEFYLKNDWEVEPEQVPYYKRYQDCRGRLEMAEPNCLDEALVMKEFDEIMEAEDEESYDYSDILSYTSRPITNLLPNRFYGTIPGNKLNQEKVNYFVSKIRSGKRPLAVLMNVQLPNKQILPGCYVLDGHHVLAAYGAMHDYPTVALITYLHSDNDCFYNLSAMKNKLYSWQFQSIWNNWETIDKRKYFPASFNGEDDLWKDYIKNGLVEKFYDNGQLSESALYIYDAIHGVSKRWHWNGQRWFERNYDHGKKIGKWVEYHSNGMEYHVVNHDEEGNKHGKETKYDSNGLLVEQRIYEHGQFADGLAFKSMYQDKRVEINYSQGKRTHEKVWDSYTLQSHKIYNPNGRDFKETVIREPQTQHYESLRQKWKNNLPTIQLVFMIFWLIILLIRLLTGT
jgi:antitoxin component YwqK of YwqJK toxin-antitoxin module